MGAQPQRARQLFRQDCRSPVPPAGRPRRYPLAWLLPVLLATRTDWRGLGLILERLARVAQAEAMDACLFDVVVPTRHHVPLARVEQLPDADAIIFGTPTRFGNMAAQMRNFLRPDRRPVGERSPGRKGRKRFHQHRDAARRTGNHDHELSQHAPSSGNDHRRCALHCRGSHPHGSTAMVERPAGTSPMPSSMLTAGADGSRQPSENELEIARFQGVMWPKSPNGSRVETLAIRNHGEKRTLATSGGIEGRDPFHPGADSLRYCPCTGSAVGMLDSQRQKVRQQRRRRRGSETTLADRQIGRRGSGLSRCGVAFR